MLGGKKENEYEAPPTNEQPQVNFNIFPYYYDVVKNHQLLKSSNLRDQIQGATGISFTFGCTSKKKDWNEKKVEEKKEVIYFRRFLLCLEMAEVAWNGGELSQTFIGKCGVLKTFATLVDTDPALKLVCPLLSFYFCVYSIQINFHLLYIPINIVHRKLCKQLVLCVEEI